MPLLAARALENIQKGILASGYLLLGKELYWRDRIQTALQKALGQEGKGVAVVPFDLRQDSLDKVLEEARALNLLTARQLLFVRNAQALGSRRPRGTDDPADRANAQTKASDTLTAYFRRPNPSTTLVFEMMDVDLESEDWKEKEKAKSWLTAFKNLCDVILLASPTFPEAMELLRQEAAERGRAVSPAAAEQLLAAFDRDMGRIRMELEKLCLFHPERERIEVEDLEPMAPAGTGYTSPALIEAIGSGDRRKALAVLEQLEHSGKYPPLVVSEVARHLRQLILLKENKVRDPQQAGKILWAARLSAPPNALPALLEHAQHFSGAQLLRGLRLAFQADLSLRSSPPDEQIILERFVLEFLRYPPPRGLRE